MSYLTGIVKRDLTSQAVFHYVNVLGAEHYDIRLIDLNKKLPPLKLEYTEQQLIRSVKYLKLKNLEGYNVYCRPLGYQYILIDDLSRNVLEDVAKVKPCLLLETSPNNFQAWLKLEQFPSNREQALHNCRAIAHQFGADKAAADPEHVGRLPGFTNRKEKYKHTNGHFPYVKLLRWADRFSTIAFNTFYLPEGGIVQSKAIPQQQMAIDGNSCRKRVFHDQSARDFGIACRMIREGKSDIEITIMLETFLHTLGRNRKAKDYIQRTIRKARIALNNQ